MSDEQQTGQPEEQQPTAEEPVIEQPAPDVACEILVKLMTDGNVQVGIKSASVTPVMIRGMLGEAEAFLVAQLAMRQAQEASKRRGLVLPNGPMPRPNGKIRV